MCTFVKKKNNDNKNKNKKISLKLQYIEKYVQAHEN